MRFDIITIFPEAVVPYTRASILGRAQKEGLITVRAHDLRQFSHERHRKVDDTPYGGGAGMVMMIQPFDEAIRKVRTRKSWFSKKTVKSRVILTAANGRKFTEADALRLAKYEQLIFLCGRYEGVDGRVEEALADEALSIGDYVLTGGELPALVMIDAIARRLPGVLGNAETLAQESHDEEGLLERPQYTKPPIYTVLGDPQGKTKADRDFLVPEPLLSGDHQAIARHRQAAQRRATD